VRFVAAVFVWALLSSNVSADAIPDPDTEIAQRHLKAGQARYEEHDYAAALAEFEAAQRSYPRPEFIFNIARCLDRLERFAPAVREYERYLADRPDDKVTRERVRQLQGRLEAEAPRRRRFPAAALGVGVTALAFAIVGTGLVASVAPDYRSVQANCPPSCPSSRWSYLRTRADVGYAAWGVAGAFAVADIALWPIWAKHRIVVDRVALRPVLAPTAIGLAGSF
jgi:tetratricopeptide (TPR) repeat protein